MNYVALLEMKWIIKSHQQLIQEIQTEEGRNIASSIICAAARKLKGAI